MAQSGHTDTVGCLSAFGAKRTISGLKRDQRPVVILAVAENDARYVVQSGGAANEKSGTAATSVEIITRSQQTSVEHSSIDSRDHTVRLRECLQAETPVTLRQKPVTQRLTPAAQDRLVRN